MITFKNEKIDFKALVFCDTTLASHSKWFLSGAYWVIFAYWEIYK